MISRNKGVTENTFTDNCGSHGLTVWRNSMTIGEGLKIKLWPLTIHKKDQKARE